MVRQGRLLPIDSAFGEARPRLCGSRSGLLVLALRSDPRQVYQRALAVFTVDEMPRAFAATRGLTMPSQLRRLRGRRDATCMRSSWRCFRRRRGRFGFSAGASAGWV